MFRPPLSPSSERQPMPVSISAAAMKLLLLSFCRKISQLAKGTSST